MWGADIKICLRVTVWRHEALLSDAKQWSWGTDFSICTKQPGYILFLAYLFDLHLILTLESPLMSHSYTLTSAILKVDVVCDIAMTSTCNVLTTELRDLLYNQCIDNTCCYSFFVYPTGRIKVCKIRFVCTGENCGKNCLVCMKNKTALWAQSWKGSSRGTRNR